VSRLYATALFAALATMWGLSFPAIPVGVGLIVQPDPTNLLAGDTLRRLIILGQVVCVALGGVLVQRTAPSMERVAMTGWAMLVGGGVLHLASFTAQESATIAALEPTAIEAVLYPGMFSTALAFIIYFTMLEERGAFEASLVPIVATIAGVALLGESVDLLSVLGFCVVFIGFALLKRHALADLVGVGVS
jgi:drug/metabolite transporter (DMT)-like permease